MIKFLLVAEGNSDAHLLGHLEELCLLCGADEVRGVWPGLDRLPRPVGHTVAEKLTAALRQEPGIGLIFVHRDADAEDDTARRQEIARAAQAAALSIPHVAVVPVQETEAWLLLDEQAIRKAADNPKGREPLNLPTVANVQHLGNPKKCLEEALCAASELSGRRLEKFRQSFPKRRALLLESLSCAGGVSGLPAWQRLQSDTRVAIARLRGIDDRLAP